jgi:hypothetical protein
VLLGVHPALVAEYLLGDERLLQVGEYLLEVEGQLDKGRVLGVNLLRIE